MRKPAALWLLLVALAAGCVGPAAPTEEAPPEEPSREARGSDRMRWEGAFTVGVDDPDDGPCGPLSSCDQRPFTLDRTTDLEARLSWTPGSDLDLYLVQDGAVVSEDGVGGRGDVSPATEQVLRHTQLPPGGYELWVSMRSGAYVSYSLDAVLT